MNAIFADTFYFLALLNPADESHAAALAFAGDASGRLVTTAWVLTELADGLAETGGRIIFPEFLRELENDPQCELIEHSNELWRAGIDLYQRRPDKGWSLTDCVSFVVMERLNMTDALTADQHFVQAGFHALLKP